MTSSDDLLPISHYFFDGPGPHVVRAGFSPSSGGRSSFTPARGQELHSLLNTSIAQLGAVSGETRRRTPAVNQPVVSIDQLVYRGRAALERAVQIREELVASGRPPTRKTVEELLDLVALAATE